MVKKQKAKKNGYLLKKHLQCRFAANLLLEIRILVAKRLTFKSRATKRKHCEVFEKFSTIQNFTLRDGRKIMQLFQEKANNINKNVIYRV